jgi:hypothetical protein
MVSQEPIVGFWVPMLMAPGWPLVLRMAHGLEITADGLVQGFVLTWLPATKQPSNLAIEDF